ncbi:ATP-binding response regulator [Halalkalirubrum salinum]|uniref:ATP-binding response regulator n=1 Tax=Halalkalirubrum salinum TaxID=2563889 RepID=UPI0010FAF935|nr:response regulator [Halalkalirubrum salinum]
MEDTIRVLHVDDDPGFADLTATYLVRECESMVVDTAANAEEAMQRLNLNTYDCVVSDYNMPGTDGISLLRTVKSEFEHLPFILFTGRGSEEVASKAISAGVTDYLQKSSGSEQYTLLANRIENAVSQAQSRQKLEIQRNQLEALHHATGELIECDSTQEIADRLVGAAEDILGFSIVVVRLYDADAGGLVPIAGSDSVSEKLPERDVFTPEGGSLNWQAYETGAVRVYDDIEELAFAADQDTGLRSLLHVPLDEYGTIAVGETTSSAFDETDVFSTRILATAGKTALRAQERESTLRSERDRIERQNDRLNEFATVLSHDLRSPLTVAHGRLELVQEEYDSDNIDAALNAIDRMNTLVDDLLRLAKEPDPDVELRSVSLASVARDCWGTVSVPEATLSIESDQTIDAEPSRLRQLLENLFRNSVEHSSTGNRAKPDDAVKHGATAHRTQPSQADEGARVSIDVRVGGLSDGGFFVEDSGPGIAPDERTDVLEMGYSTSPDNTGFGLAIVKDIATEHGWEMQITESTAGGARFEFV